MNDISFVGEEIFYLQDGSLRRMGDPAAPASVVLGEDLLSMEIVGRGSTRSALLVASEREHKLVVLRSDSPGTPDVFPLQRPVADPVLAADGRRLALFERLTAEAGRIRIIDLESGRETEASLPLPPPPPPDDPSATWPPPGRAPPGEPGSPDKRPALREYLAELEFRPSSEELWCFLGDQLAVVGSDGKAHIHPGRGASLTRFDSSAFVSEEVFNEGFWRFSRSRAGLDGRSRFSADGRFWSFEDGRDLGFVGNADDPGAEPSLRLFGDRDVDWNLHEVVPGRWVAFWVTQDFGNRDLYLVDLQKRANRLLARNVARAQFGLTRAVLLTRALHSEDGGPGDLVVVDLASGLETLLARNVTSFALRPPCPDCYPVQAGATVAYVVQARVPWRYDGLWSGSLP